MKYNLACGNDRNNLKLKDYIHLDKKELDLNKDFKLKDCDKIRLAHILEHFDNEDVILKRCHNTINEKGIIQIFTPSINFGMFHKQPVHYKDYFYSLSTDNKRSDELCNIFDVVYQKGHIDLKRKYYRFRNWFLNILYDEWEYVLRKK